MEPGEYVKAVRRRWPVVAIVVALAAALGWVTAPNSSPKTRYRATAIISVRATSGAALPLDPITPEIVATQATSNEVAGRAKEKLGFQGPPEKLAAQVETKFDLRGNSVRISSTQSSAETATNVANTFTEELLAYLQERQDRQVQDAVDAGNKSISDLQAQAAKIEERIAASTDPAEQARLKGDRSANSRAMAAVLARLQQFDNLRGPGTARANLVRDASVAAVAPALGPPSSAAARAAIAAGVGLLLGVALALFLDRLDPTLRTRARAEAAFGLPVIAEVPRSRSKSNRVDVAAEPRSALAESYRTLRIATTFMPVAENGTSPSHRNGSHPEQGNSDGASLVLDFSSPETDLPDGSPGRLIVVTSSGPGEGTTAAAVNLAATFAETGKSVIVVGGDLRDPDLAGYLGLSETPGITDVLDREAGTSPPRVIRRTSIPGLSVLPSGSAVDNPAGILTRARDLVLQCRSLADVVIVDTPPLLVANDAVDFILAADAVIVVARSGRTTVDSAQRAAELLRRLKAPVVGVAVIGLNGTH